MNGALPVLLDVQSLHPGTPATGTASYAGGLLGALAILDGLDLAALCAPGTVLPTGVRAIEVTRSATAPRAQVMEQALRLPIEVRRHRHGRTVFHNLAFHAPPGLPHPWVQTLHDVIPLAYPSPDLAALRRRWRRLAPRYRSADAVIAVSHHAARDGIAHLGLRPERVHVAHHGVDPAFVPGAGPADPPYLLALGEESLRKGFADAFTLIDELADAGYPHRLVVVGRDRTARLERLRAASRHPQRIELLGLVPDVVPLYQGSTALVMTSRYEGFGLPTLEAMACGVPVVAFANSAVTEVADGAAVLVADGDRSALLAAVRQVLNTPALATELGERGLDHAASYTWARSAVLHREVYRSVAEPG
ncbi:MAG TPA: glycosyltransferase family 1 protein [Acidimicrobiales bacterium]